MPIEWFDSVLTLWVLSFYKLNLKFPLITRVEIGLLIFQVPLWSLSLNSILLNWREFLDKFEFYFDLDDKLLFFYFDPIIFLESIKMLYFYYFLIIQFTIELFDLGSLVSKRTNLFFWWNGILGSSMEDKIILLYFNYVLHIISILNKPNLSNCLFENWSLHHHTLS